MDWRWPIIVLAIAALPGCGLYRQKQQAEVSAQLRQVMADSVEECRLASPDEVKQAIVRATCINQAIELIRPGYPYPDLLDQENAMRMSLAEKVQTRKMTIIERNQMFTQFHSQIVSEEQRRSMANRAVGAQEAIAAAASSPVICNRIGTTTICN